MARVSRLFRDSTLKESSEIITAPESISMPIWSPTYRLMGRPLMFAIRMRRQLSTAPSQLRTVMVGRERRTALAEGGLHRVPGKSRPQHRWLNYGERMGSAAHSRGVQRLDFSGPVDVGLSMAAWLRAKSRHAMGTYDAGDSLERLLGQW